MFKKAKENKKGFTLAELLIVVAIIAVLVAISIPIFTKQLEKSREAVDAANLRSAYAAGQIEVLNGTVTGTADQTVWYNPSTGALSANGVACGKGTATEGGGTIDLPSVCHYTQNTNTTAMGIQITYNENGVSSVDFAAIG